MERKRDIWVPLKKNKTQQNEAERTNRRGEPKTEREKNIYIFFISLLSSQIHGNLTVGFRRVKNEKCSTRRGLRVGTKNTGFH